MSIREMTSGLTPLIGEQLAGMFLTSYCTTPPYWGQKHWPLNELLSQVEIFRDKAKELSLNK